MRLVSMSLYARLDKQNAALTVYRATLDQLFKSLLHAAPDWRNKTLMPDDLLDSTPLVIVASAAKGLCGSFHTNLIRYFERLFFDQEHQTVHFVAVGQKAVNFINDKIHHEKKGKLVLSYTDINSHNLDLIAHDIIRHIHETRPRYSSVTCYNNMFVNFFKQKPQTLPLIPLLSPIELHNGPLQIPDHIWEQEPHIIVDKLAERYLATTLTHILMQSLLAEQAARFVAMDSATTNAEKYLEKLTLQYNKMRQSLITKEVTELIAGL